MPTLDEIRRRKLEEIMQLQQEKMQQQSQEQAQAQQQLEYIENVVKQFLSKEALMRYGSLKAAHQDKAFQVAMILFQAIQKGQVKSKIDDLTLKKVLEQLTPVKRDIKIQRA